MCGIVGYWSRNRAARNSVVIERMTGRLSHRGPDDTGAWLSEDMGLALGHRRLAILDLSPSGHQPMTSPCARLTLVFNGEIYNHLDLRKELDRSGGGFRWKGHSDTETLLAALRFWGLAQTLKRLNGMFAFALWDREERTLSLARDRLGEKPLYYGNCGGTFLFGSELKSLAAHPEWRGEIDRDALALFLRHNYVPSPWSIYRGIFKLPPAHYLVVREGDSARHSSTCYWDLRVVAERGLSARGASADDLEHEFECLFREAVSLRMAADVPLGAFLSGGYDSSTVVALMQSLSRQPIKTFTIGFAEQRYDEARLAGRVAKQLGTDHTEMYVAPEEALAVIPRLPSIWDEPFSDSSQIPTLLVSELARRHVSVVLSGDGGDELFYGYSRYRLGLAGGRVIDWTPRAIRRVVSTLLNSLPTRYLDSLGRSLPGRLATNALGDRLRKIAAVVDVADGDALYHRLMSHCKDPGALVYEGVEPATLFLEPDRWPSLPSLAERMMYLDTLTYLPDDILTKVDRASMAVGLEARVPFLDHRVVEFAWRVPMSLKCRRGQGKWLVRQLLHRYVSRDLVDRPKMGFGIPIDSWLRFELRDWAEELLNAKRLREEGFFDPAPIRRMWDEHAKGVRRWHYYLWDVLMFQAWLDGQAHNPAVHDSGIGAAV